MLFYLLSKIFSYIIVNIRIWYVIFIPKITNILNMWQCVNENILYAYHWIPSFFLIIYLLLIKYFFVIFQIFQYQFPVRFRHITSNNKFIQYKISLKISHYHLLYGNWKSNQVHKHCQNIYQVLPQKNASTRV